MGSDGHHMAPWASMGAMVLRKWISILGLAPKAGEEATAKYCKQIHKISPISEEIG